MNQSNSPQKPQKIRIILGSLFLLCGCTFLLDFLFLSDAFDKHAVYQWENWPGFYAIFGFVACLLLVLISKYILRPLVKRDEDYYE